jgi:hypothetical protein
MWRITGNTVVSRGTIWDPATWIRRGIYTSQPRPYRSCRFGITPPRNPFLQSASPVQPSPRCNRTKSSRREYSERTRRQRKRTPAFAFRRRRRSTNDSARSNAFPLCHAVLIPRPASAGAGKKPDMPRLTLHRLVPAPPPLDPSVVLTVQGGARPLARLPIGPPQMRRLRGVRSRPRRRACNTEVARNITRARRRK